MITQSFLYNAFFFTYEGVLDHFYGKPANIAAVYFLPFAAATCSVRCCSGASSTPSADAR